MTNNLDLDTIMNLLCLEGKITEQHAAGIKAVLVDVLEEVRSETLKEAVRVIEGERYEVDVDKEPTISDEAWGNQYDNKCEAFWYGEKEGLKALRTAITAVEGLENNK